MAIHRPLDPLSRGRDVDRAPVLLQFRAGPGARGRGHRQGRPGPAAIGKYIAPRALLWFRWAAVATWVSGAAYLGARFPGAFTLGIGAQDVYLTTIGMGAWLGTIMIFNVWFLIWPNQKKVLGLVSATDEEKARARRVAFLASRTNTLLSIPMLLFMGAARSRPALS